MIDDTQRPANSSSTNTSSEERTGTPPVGYCQECGRPLSISTLQRLGANVFCTTCASYRQASPGWQSVQTGPYGAGPAQGAPPAGDPNPVFAGVLGLIPGVGAMYNGQYAKGAMHLIVFVILVSLADNLNWVFYWLVWGWVFYQAFDAYHTARARRDGQPLPNPFGWNEIGERFGAARSTTPPTVPPAGPVPGFGAAPPPRPEADWARHNSTTEPVMPRYANYAEPPRPTGDNPYTAPFPASGTPQTPPPVPPASPYMGNVPYAPTYTGGSSDLAPGLAANDTGRRFPVGAAWLIGLGVLFLIGNLSPGWRLSGRWLTPVLLAAVAAWSAIRRWEHFRGASLTVGGRPNLAAAMTWPAVLLTVAFLMAVQAFGLVGIHRSWPVLLVIWGLLQAAQRSATATPYVPAPLPAAPPAKAPVRSTSGTGHLGL